MTLTVDQGSSGAVFDPGSSIVVRWTADPDLDEAYDFRSWDFLALFPSDKTVGKHILDRNIECDLWPFVLCFTH